MRYEIDLSGLKDRPSLHARLRETLGLPDWYGDNLDALADILTEGGERALVFRGAEDADPSLSDYLGALRRMLSELSASVPGLTVVWEDGGSRILARSRELRDDPTTHYNCAQGVLIPFAEAAGLDAGAAARITANFGSGMKRGSVCGAVTGGLMALGLLGVEDNKTVAEFYRRLKEAHAGCLDCADLLRMDRERGGDRKTHCDGMVYECAALAEELARGSQK